MYQSDLKLVSSLIVKKYFQALAVIEQYRGYFSKLIWNTNDLTQSQKLDFTQKIMKSALKSLIKTEDIKQTDKLVPA